MGQKAQIPAGKEREKLHFKWKAVLPDGAVWYTIYQGAKKKSDLKRGHI